MADNTLYELTGDLLQLQQMLEADAEDQAVVDTIEAYNVELEEKAEGYCKIISNFKHKQEQIKAQAALLKAEADRLKKRADAVQAKIDKLRDNLLNSMRALDKKSIKTLTHTISATCKKDQITIDYDKLALAYLEYKEPAVDKTATKKKLQEMHDVSEICGVTVEDKHTLTIR